MRVSKPVRSTSTAGAYCGNDAGSGSVPPPKRNVPPSTRNRPAAVQRFQPIHLTRDINPRLTFSVSFLSSPQKHPLYANPWKQWRLARGETEGKDVKR